MPGINYPMGCFNSNLKLQEQEYLKNELVLKSRPSKMCVIFGNRCNLNCKMCGNRGPLTRFGLRKTTKLNRESIEDFISYLPYLQNVTFSGGEPLAYKDLKYLIEIAKQNPKLNLKLMTNGNMINDSWANVLCQAHFGKIAISVDAATNKTYKKIRVRGNFDKVLQAIKNINERKNENRPEIQLSYVIMRRNFYEMIPFMELAHQYNVNSVSYQTISNQRAFFYSLEKVTHSRKECEQLLKLSLQLQNLADDYDIKLVNKIPANIMNDNPKFFFDYYNINRNDLNDNGDFKCKASWEKLDISPLFYNTCCFSVPTKNAPIYYNNGEVPKIHEIWNDPIFINTRKLMVDGKYDGICRVSCLKFFKYKTKGVI